MPAAPPAARIPDRPALAVRHACCGAALALLLHGCGGGGAADDPPPPAAEPIERSVASTASPVAAACTGGRSSGSVFVDAEVEPFVAVSPLDPDHLVGAWQQDRASNGGARALVSATSFDGGRSWQRTLQPLSRCGGAAPGSPGDHERATDPWVDVGPGGTVYLMGLAFSGNLLEPGSSSAMLVRLSGDGGRSWSAPQTLQRDGADRFNDKNTLTADPTDARFVYAVWDRLDVAGNGPTLLARSVDGGASWEPAREIFVPRASGGISQTIGNRIVVLTDGPERGLLVNAFMQLDTVDRRTSARLRVMRSTDQGRSWSEPVTVAESLAVGTRDPDTGVGVRDGAILPAVAAGPGGMLWLAWQDARFSGGRRDAIALARSSDGGRSWSAPLAVNRAAGVAAFTPTLHARADGTLALMHFDLRSNSADPGTLLADLWLLTSRDGAQWSETPLARGFDLNRAATAGGAKFLGDYHGLVSAGPWLLPLVALPGSGDGNPSDVVALRVPAPAAAATFAARPLPAAAASDRRLRQAHHDAITRAMDARLPGWSRRVQQARQ